MAIGLIICVFLGFIFWALGSYILVLHENLDEFKWKYLKNLKCKTCKKKIKRRSLLSVDNVCFQNNKCANCKRRCYMLLILEMLTALLFCLIWYYCRESNIFIIMFWMLSWRILLINSISDLLWYEISVSLVVIWWISALITMTFWFFDWMCLWWAFIFLWVFVILYYGSLIYTKMKYKIEEEGVWMWDLIFSPYLGVLLYMGVSTTNVEELFCAVLMFFMFTSIIWIFVYIIQNIIIGKKANFLSKEMADRALPLVPSMSIALAIVILCHGEIFNFLMKSCDFLVEYLMNTL